MLIKVDDVVINTYPSNFTVTQLDLDDPDATKRTSDGILNRNRITQKCKIELEWGEIEGSHLASLLSAFAPEFISFYFPDPLTNGYSTKTMYASDKPVTFSYEHLGTRYWKGLKFSLTEK